MVESQRLYDRVETLNAGGVPADYYRLPLGQPDIKRPGRDLTLLTIGPALYPALAAAEELEAAHGISAEVMDARTLVPFDYAPVLASLARTGRLMLISEACERGSFPMTLAANLTRFGFSDLKVPPRVVGSPNWIVPGADMETTYFPQADDIVDIATAEMFEGTGRNRRGVRGWDDLALARHGL